MVDQEKETRDKLEKIRSEHTENQTEIQILEKERAYLQGRLDATIDIYRRLSNLGEEEEK